MKKLFFLLILILICSVSNAQTDTTNWIYDLDEQNKKLYTYPYFNNPILKIINNDRIDTDYFLGLTLRKQIETEQLKIYQDKNCQRVYKETDCALNKVTTDTIITFDSETFAESMKIVFNDLSKFPNENTYYQLTQSWKLDKRTNELTSKIINYHIIEMTENDTTRLFSIKNPTATISNSEDIIWIKSMTCQNQFTDTTLINLLLSETYLSQQILVKKQFYREPTYIDYAKVDELYGVKTDTLKQFDSESLKWKITYRTYSVLDDVKEFRVVQDFYFNAKTNAIESKVLAIGVIVPTNINYSFRSQYIYYNSLIFWIVYNDDFLKMVD
ncbi:MAG: hypothetical protein AB8G11_21110 [Saprospiraceae bacterium]